MRHTLALLMMATLATALAPIAGCGFPGVDYRTTGDSSGDATSDGTTGDTLDSAADGVAPDDAPGDALNETGSDGAPVSDARSPGDGGRDAPVDTAADVDCDVDKDGYNAMGAACGGTDCCDTDADANPGQTMYFTSHDGCGSYDYNCDNKVETEITANIVCGGTGLAGCSGGPGFTSSPSCGSMAPYSVCQGSGLLACTAQSSMMATQACH
jgi:hypothetical protein